MFRVTVLNNVTGCGCVFFFFCILCAMYPLLGENDAVKIQACGSFMYRNCPLAAGVACETGLHPL